MEGLLRLMRFHGTSCRLRMTFSSSPLAAAGSHGSQQRWRRRKPASVLHQLLDCDACSRWLCTTLVDTDAETRAKQSTSCASCCCLAEAHLRPALKLTGAHP